MWTDGSEENSGDIGVDERAAGGEGVGGGTGGGGEDAAVSLDNGYEVVVRVELELRDIGGWATVNDEFWWNMLVDISVKGIEKHTIEHLKLLGFFGLAVNITVNSAGEPHLEVNPHAIIQHLVEMFLVALKLKVGQKAQAAQREAENWRDDALEQPGREQDGSITSERQDEVEFLRMRPAEIRRPVFEHIGKGGLHLNHALCIKALRILELEVDIDVYAHGIPKARRLHEPVGHLPRQRNKVVIPRLRHNHDILDLRPDRPLSKLSRNLPHARRRLHKPRMAQILVMGNLIEHLLNIDRLIKLLMKEARALERIRSLAIPIQRLLLRRQRIQLARRVHPAHYAGCVFEARGGVCKAVFGSLRALQAGPRGHDGLEDGLARDSVD